MNLERCENGHFYDSDLYATCPHCGAQTRNDDVTVALTQVSADDSVTQAQVPAVSLTDAVKRATGARIDAGEDAATVGYYDKTLGVEPVVGWLVCIEGNNIGLDYRLKSGRNFIGRASDMDVAITGDESVSRDRHAIIVYEPRAHIFLVQAGESKELCYLNDKVVHTTDEIQVNDVLTVGATKLMFFPCCGSVFNWEMATKEGEE